LNKVSESSLIQDSEKFMAANIPTLVCRLIPYHRKVDHISLLTTCAGKNAKQKIFAHFASSQVKMVNRMPI